MALAISFYQRFQHSTTAGPSLTSEGSNEVVLDMAARLGEEHHREQRVRQGNGLGGYWVGSPWKLVLVTMVDAVVVAEFEEKNCTLVVVEDWEVDDLSNVVAVVVFDTAVH
ncbi:hypothetical protein FGSG_13836 [Fusarium graminearum PH-1]|uniref:hypothetical protein n=1 Tax=Gibberella zeae (strain ATCC MYA-4620 / CBS 123657 / FGSC 9075 / NRRL 31084 / PH-1) TaxID=229533 RepID=UPI00021F12F1|nr:hypothetical protein FGSG_13836 [Fusarium graminearum PH-1]ESU17520.1 hypothetical protein FGSG_13836 [Fusarium graminearum PH-1]|eukprot:XP_011325142.1 hypothetical protein FGSG_13836 [Fusarium graminearum PH-1]